MRSNRTLMRGLPAVLTATVFVSPLMAQTSGAGGTVADLSVSIHASPDPVAPGAVVTHRITITNNGPGVAQGVRLLTSTPFVPPFTAGTTGSMVPELPAGWSCELLPPPPVVPHPPSPYFCSVAAMPVGSVTVTMRAAVRTDVAGPLGLQARVDANTSDPVSGNNDSGLVNVGIGVAPPQSIPAGGWLGLTLLMLLAGALGLVALRGRI